MRSIDNAYHGPIIQRTGSCVPFRSKILGVSACRANIPSVHIYKHTGVKITTQLYRLLISTFTTETTRKSLLELIHLLVYVF